MALFLLLLKLAIYCFYYSTVTLILKLFFNIKTIFNYRQKEYGIF